jgi:hypothetical protein
MSRIRSMLDRVRKLEAIGKNPLLAKIGSLERLEKIMSEPPPEVDPKIGPFFMACVRGWIDGSHTEHNGKPIPEEFNV